MRLSFVRAAGIPVLIAGHVVPAAAQALLRTFIGPAARAGAGWSVAGAGGVNGDGFPDAVTGSPAGESGGALAGRVEVRSGFDGSLLNAWTGTSAGDLFGRSVDGGPGVVRGRRGSTGVCAHRGPPARHRRVALTVRRRGGPLFELGTGDPIEPTPALIREAFLRSTAEIGQYPLVAGRPAMRRAAAGYLKRRFEIDVDPDEEMLPTQGSKEAIFHMPMVLVEPPTVRTTIVYGVPAYPVFEIGSYFAEAETFEVPLYAGNRYLMDPAAVPEAVPAQTAVVVLNDPHNPTGQELPEAPSRAWVAARRCFGFTLVSDECYPPVSG